MPWISAIVAVVGVVGGMLPTTPGVGVAAAKSAALSAVLVSVALRVTDWVFEAPSAGPLPAYAGGRRAVPDEVDDRRRRGALDAVRTLRAVVVRDERDLARRPAHRDRAGRVCRSPASSPPAPCASTTT